jgi:hypothetical protein
MKRKFMFIFSLLAAFACSIAVAADEPVAFAPEGIYTFESVPEGTKITHEFIIQNKGTAPLNIENVKTG